MEQELTNTLYTTKQNKPRKKPGRPRKVIKPTSDVVISGVLDRPNDTNHRMELIHYEPRAFKQIVNMLKHYFVDAIFIHFDIDYVSIKSHDHTKTTSISITIDCNKISEYYCKEPFTISVRCEYLTKVLATITNSHDKIALSSNIDSYQSCFDISLIDDDASIHDKFTIDLCMAQPENISVVELNDYLIKFTMYSKALKKFINDTLFSKMLTIEKQDGNYLKFKTSYNHKVACTRTFCNDNSINLDTKLEKHEYLNVNLKIESIKPFSDAIITDVVNIYVNTRNVVFEKIIGDHIITQRIHTDVINYGQ